MFVPSRWFVPLHTPAPGWFIGVIPDLQEQAENKAPAPGGCPGACPRTEKNNRQFTILQERACPRTLENNRQLTMM
jgi:hypothetical protein